MTKKIAFFGLLAGCTTFNDRRPPVRTEVRDVPVVARGENDAPRTRALILPFLEDRPNGPLGEVARPAVTRELVRSGQVLIATVDEIPSELRRPGPGGEYDLPLIAGKVAPLGIGAVIEGKVLEVTVRKLGDTLGLIREAKARVTARVRVRINGGKNGKEIYRGERTVEVESTATFVAEVGGTGGSGALRDDPDLTRGAVIKAFASAVPDAVHALEKLGWEGRVASIAGERVFINAGRLTGLQVGDILKVTEDGDDIYDPDTGRFIGTAPGRLKGTVEVLSYFGRDGAIAVIHSGSGFRENDHVELY